MIPPVGTPESAGASPQPDSCAYPTYADDTAVAVNRYSEPGRSHGSAPVAPAPSRPSPGPPLRQRRPTGLGPVDLSQTPGRTRMRAVGRHVPQGILHACRTRGPPRTPADDTADVGALDGTDGTDRTDRTDRTDGEFDRKLGRWAWIAIAAVSACHLVRLPGFRRRFRGRHREFPARSGEHGRLRPDRNLSVSDVSTPTTASVTGVRVLIGAGTELDLDSGTVVASSVSVGDREWVSELRQIGEITYVVVRDCDIDTVRVLSVDGSGSAEPLRPPSAPGEE